MVKIKSLILLCLILTPPALAREATPSRDKCIQDLFSKTNADLTYAKKGIILTQTGDHVLATTTTGSMLINNPNCIVDSHDLDDFIITMLVGAFVEDKKGLQPESGKGFFQNWMNKNVNRYIKQNIRDILHECDISPKIHQKISEIWNIYKQDDAIPKSSGTSTQ